MVYALVAFGSVFIGTALKDVSDKKEPRFLVNTAIGLVVGSMYYWLIP